MEDSTKDYYKTNIKMQTQMKLRQGVRTEFNEDAPVNATGPAVAGIDKNPPVSVAAQSNYAKKNKKESPVLAMVARSPLKTFREFLER